MRLEAGACGLVVVACWQPFGPPKPAVRELQLPITTLQLENGLRTVVIVDERAPDVQVTMQYGLGAI